MALPVTAIRDTLWFRGSQVVDHSLRVARTRTQATEASSEIWLYNSRPTFFRMLTIRDRNSRGSSSMVALSADHRKITPFCIGCLRRGLVNCDLQRARCRSARICRHESSDSRACQVARRDRHRDMRRVENRRCAVISIPCHCYSRKKIRAS
jgi:hypothetical protein